MVKRLKILFIIFFTVMGALVLRVAYIQLLGHEDLSAAARAQQEIVLEGADTRGIIYDRNGTPVAGGHSEYVYIIRSENYDGETRNALNQLYAEEIPNENGEYKVFVSQLYSKNIGERLIRNSGAYILETDRRYRENQPAVHMVGYINPKDSKGVSGLEYMYEKELSMINKEVSAVADVNGILLRGYGLTVSSMADDDCYVKQGITTTLELGLQQETQRILNESGKNGAVVVTGAESGEIIASASSPVFDPYEIERYMDSSDGELVNKVTQGTYPPGSVFKIIVAAAALENGVSPDKIFECKGNITINGRSIRCQTGGEAGHGKISFKQAFAESCNCTFIELGQITGARNIIEMAKRFGLGKTVLDGFPGEEDGNIMSVYDSEGAAIANLSIGQGENLVTPLQVAAITAIVANDGALVPMTIIRDTEQESRECISDNVTEALKEMMELTVKNGTGDSLELPVPAGVKTGSAESMQGGTEVVHGWITGYIPADDPEYVITVFVEDGKSGRESAGPLFSEVVQYIYEMEMIGDEIGV